MRIELPTSTERFGAVSVHGIQHVYELDSGLSNGCSPEFEATQPIRCLPYDAINETEKRMAIVVPCKQERLKVLEGVLCGIPHDCLAILVSNSSREPVDRFNMEREAFLQFCHLVQRPAVLVHQRDPGVAAAFDAAGYSDILSDDGLVRNGKAEGMIIGLLIAKLCGKDFIGFIDADNYVPGAVHEYAKEYAAGFHLAQTPYAMTRISWHSKPKIQGSKLFFNRWGRCSENTNYFLNQLMSHYSGFGTEIIKTGNAGEHAMSMALAERLKFASGYAVEPYEYIHLLELFGGVHASPYPEVMKKRVEIFQIETRNPHFHEDKGEDHVADMQNVALDVLYHSTICPQPLKEEIHEYLRANDGLDETGEPKQVRIYPPINTMDQDAFLRGLADSGETFEQIEHVLPASVQVESPIDIPDFSNDDAPTKVRAATAKAAEPSLVASNGSNE